jgi:RimJ/RimL family protein N-acetyltransferase
MEITELPADDSDLVREVVDLTNAVNEVDSPWFHPETELNLRNQILHGWDGEPDQHFVGVDGGRVVAHLRYFTPGWDNPQLAWLGIAVAPSLRGRGYGAQAMYYLLDRAGSDGRTKIGSDTWEGNPGEGFLSRRGFVKASQSINRRQHLAEVSLDDVRTVYAEASAAAAAYELVKVVGQTPEDLMPAVAAMSAAINDAPLDDLDIEDEVFPPERIAAYEQAQLASGGRLYRLLARHRETGELAGHTVAAVEVARPGIGHQHDTSVVRAHRGHRLGLLLKAGMILWLAEAEPQLETVSTWNAESNDHMIAVNERLGYRWMGRQLEYMLHTDRG